MLEKKPLLLKTIKNRFIKSFHIVSTHMFGHSHAGNFIKFFFAQVPVIYNFYPNFIPKPFPVYPLICIFFLFRTQGYANHLDMVISGCVNGKISPAASNVQQVLPFFQSQFSADNRHFFILGIGHGGIHAAIVTTGIAHGLP